MKEEDILEKQQLHISVRNLVEFIFREGDIDHRFGKLQSADAMLEGSRIHRKIQKSMGSTYQSEVPLKLLIEAELYDLTIEGRADGIFTDEEHIVWIDEIKGVYRNLDTLEEAVFVHKAQAMGYGYIFALQNHLAEIGIQMTYCNIETEEKKYFRQVMPFSEIQQWFFDLVEQYRKWAEFQCRWRKIRQNSIQNLTFPFAYRKGQKKLVTDVYRTILRGKNLFLQAPTGVGKTISTIFPAIKAVGENLAERIFYLTAKTVTAAVARDTFFLLENQGYRAKSIQITAKEKLCLCEEMECNPVNCPYARGHYDRVNDAVFDLLGKDCFYTREVLMEQAQKFRVCPFEFCLDVSGWCDNIICDYNYVYDPNVYLKRFFQENTKGDTIFLVDEAHNLVERSREMYSAVLCKEDLLSVKRILKERAPRVEKLLAKCNKIFLEYKRECEEYVQYESLGNLYFAVFQLAGAMEEFFQKPVEFAGKKEVLDFYFELRNFLNIYELVDEHYEIYSQISEEGRFYIKLFCVDPSLNLQRCIDKGRSTIFFSATFLPINYYKQLLSTKEDNYAVYAESSFHKEQSLVLIASDVSSKYTRRGKLEYQKIAEYIQKAVYGKMGNYMIFFPSYRFMQEVYEEFAALDKGLTRTIIQKTGMSETEREEFLQEFEKEKETSLAAFCVMGGIFGEGIDLTEDKLIGAVIVGTGLPQICTEREILKKYYDRKNGNGFDYAFRYPGINKVLQAAGRVIRTNEDRGIILLLDERFLQSDYVPLFPREWGHRSVCQLEHVEEHIKRFWQ